MEKKVNGIVIRAVSYGESDKILTIYTLEEGLVSARIKGVKKAGAKLKACSEPFCFAEAVISEKSGRKTITEINPFDNFYPVRTDVVKYYAGMCALELTNAFMPEGLVAEGHFVLLAEFLKKLAYSTINAVNLLVKFFYDAAEENGFAINLSFCGRCGKPIEKRVFLSSREGICVCEACRKEGDGGYSIDTYKYLKKISENDMEAGDDKLRKNGLKFFGYYLEKVSGVNLKSLPELIAMI